MTDRNRYEQSRQGVDGRVGGPENGRAPQPRGRQDEHRSWDRGSDGDGHLGRGGNTAYGRTSVGSSDRSEGYGHSGGYGSQGGFGSQHGQGGYASPAQGAAYGQTSSQWGRSGYGGFDDGGANSDRRHGGGEAGGFGRTSYAAEQDAGDVTRPQDDSGLRSQGGGGTPFTTGRGEAGTYGGDSGQAQQDYRRSNQRSTQRGSHTVGDRGYEAGGSSTQARRELSYEADYRDYGDDRGQSGASGGYAADDDHEPHYRRWRDQQLAGHDQDYNRWRAEQTKRYDDEYRSYRDTRHHSFTKDFGDWRNKSLTLDKTSSVVAASGQPGGAGSTDGTAVGGVGSVENVADGGSGHVDHDKHDAEQTS